MSADLSDTCEMPNETLYDAFVNATVESCTPNDNSTAGCALEWTHFLAHHAQACAQLKFDLIVSWVVPIIFTIIVILGVIGNSLVLIVVLFGQQMRNTTNVLILNLALSDLLFVTICIPPTAVDYAIGWPFGNTCCKLVQYLVHATTFSSVYTLVLLSLDRYLAVVYPVKSISLRTVKNVSIAIIITWMVTFCACIPLLFAFKSTEVEFAHGEIRTICTFDEQNHNDKLYQSLLFLSSLAVPLLAIMWLYVNMLLRLWRGSAAACGPGPARDKSNSRSLAATARKTKGKENKRRVTRMILIVIIVFALCWTPLQIVMLLRKFNLYDISESGGLVVLQIITHCLAYCNSCLNPILYAFFSPNFRSAFINTCRSKNHQQGPQHSQGVSRSRRDNNPTNNILRDASEAGPLIVVRNGQKDNNDQAAANGKPYQPEEWIECQNLISNKEQCNNPSNCSPHNKSSANPEESDPDERENLVEML